MFRADHPRRSAPRPRRGSERRVQVFRYAKLERRLRVVPSLDQRATQGEHGAYPRALMPSASQRSEPMSVARIGGCGSCSWRLFSGTTCRPSPSISEAPCAARAPGLFIAVMLEFSPLARPAVAGSQASASCWLMIVRFPIFRPRSRPDFSSSYVLVGQWHTLPKIWRCHRPLLGSALPFGFRNAPISFHWHSPTTSAGTVSGDCARAIADDGECAQTLRE